VDFLFSNLTNPELRNLAKQIVEELLVHLREGDQLITPEYLSHRQVSKLTSIPIKTLEAMRGTRKDPPYYKVGGRIRYKVQDVRDFIEKGGPVE